MTQIVGIVCREGIVIASESQYTIGRRKLLNAEKLSTLEFKDSKTIGGVFGGALIAEAGNLAKSSLAVRYMVEIAQNREIDSEDAVAKIAQEAVTKVRRDILSTMQDRQYSVAEQDEIFRSGENYFALMIANYFYPTVTETNWQPPAVPCLYTISLIEPIAVPEHQFAVLGAATELAMFVLKQFECEKLLWGEAACLAIDVLERINNDDITCGGPIRLGTVHSIINSQSMAAIYGDELVSRVLKKLEVVKKRNNERQRKELGTVMKKIHNEDFKKEIKRLTARDEESNRLREWARINHPVTGKSGPSAVHEVKPEETT